MQTTKMTYLVAPPHKILRFLVGPLLSWPLFGEVHQLVDKLLLTLFAMWRPVPDDGGRRDPVKA